MGQQMVMSLNEHLPCGFWAADDARRASRRLAAWRVRALAESDLHETSIDSTIAHAIFD